MVAIVAASMSTGDGAILAMGTVWSHNILRKVKSLLPDGTEDGQLLEIARISSFFFAAIAAAIASAKPDKTGYFLIVAFVSHTQYMLPVYDLQARRFPCSWLYLSVYLSLGAG